MCLIGLTSEDASDRAKWRRLSWDSHGQHPRVSEESGLKMPVVVVVVVVG